MSEAQLETREREEEFCLKGRGWEEKRPEGSVREGWVVGARSGGDGGGMG